MWLLHESKNIKKFDKVYSDNDLGNSYKINLKNL